MITIKIIAFFAIYYVNCTNIIQILKLLKKQIF